VLAVLGVIVLAVLAVVIEISRLGGVFRFVDEGFAGRCAAVALGGSAEDIQIDRERGIAYLSVLDRASLSRGERANGSVMLLDLNLAEPAPRAALAYDPAGFRPHGLSLLARAGEPVRLFAISHPADGSHTVEILEREASGAFVPKQTVRDALFTHPNAVVAVGPRQFYIANDTTGGRDSAPVADAVLRRGDSTIVYYDGSKARVVASGLRFVAGIAASPDGERLYVGEALGGQLRVYRRDGASGALADGEVVPLGTAPDNLNVDADGVVWMGAHPKLFAFVEHMRDAAQRAPAQVLRFDPRAKGARVTQVYASDGSALSAASVAARWRDEFLIGAVLDHQVLICKTQP
jgi:arylesterase/paraoxonase